MEQLPTRAISVAGWTVRRAHALTLLTSTASSIPKKWDELGIEVNFCGIGAGCSITQAS